MTKPKDPADYLKVGRPTKYSQKLARHICEIVATKRGSLKKLCDMHEELPDQNTVNQWLRKYPEFHDQYYIAKRDQINICIDEIDEIMEETLSYYTDERGQERIDSPSVTLAIAKANNRKWYASKLAPKLYGDRTMTESNDDTLLKDSIDRKRELDDKNKKDY